MKKTITVLKITALVLAASVLALAFYAYVWKQETPEMQPAPVAAQTEPPETGEIAIPETIHSEELPEPTAPRAKIAGKPQIYWSEHSSLEEEPGVTTEEITGRIFMGYPADVNAMPMNRAICRNLTMDGVDMDVPVNLLFKWEDIQQIRPGDGVQLHDKLIRVENVLTEEDMGTPGLIAINTGKYFFRHHPALYGGGSLGWGTTEADCMFVYDEYFSAKTIVPDVHLDFHYPRSFYFSIGNSMTEKEEFVEKLTGKIFQATGSYGTEYGMLDVDNFDTDVIDADLVR